MPHIRQKLYDPSSAKKLKRLSTGFYDLNTYKAPEHKSIHAFSGSVNCPVLFDDYMTRLFPVEAERKFMIRWLARSVIQPDYKIRTAPLLRGGQGTGKSYLIDTVLSQLAGKHNVLNTSLGRITGQFNAAVATCTVCCLDETYSHKKSSADKLKKFVTDEYITITEKHVDSRQAKIYANIVILSNDKYPIYILKKMIEGTMSRSSLCIGTISKKRLILLSVLMLGLMRVEWLNYIATLGKLIGKMVKTKKALRCV